MEWNIFLNKNGNMVGFFTHYIDMDNEYQSFEDLWIWKESMSICYEVYDCMEGCRDFGLRNQMQECSVSVPSNISEGFELHTDRAFIRHLYISKGSAAELRTQTYIAIHRKYISVERGENLIIRIKRLGAGIQNYIKARKAGNWRKTE